MRCRDRVYYKNIKIGNKLQKVYVDCIFDSTKSKRLSVVLVEVGDEAHCFAQVLLLLHLNDAEVSTQVEEYAIVQYSDVINPTDDVDSILKCLKLGGQS